MSSTHRYYLARIAAAVAMWALLVVSFVWWLTDEDPSLTQQAISECAALGPDIRVTLLRDDGDGTWTVIAQGGVDDTFGRGTDELLDQPAEVVYPGDVAEDLRAMALDVLGDRDPRTVSTVFNNAEITTRIVPMVANVAMFCTAIGG